ncbi:MAG: hypothetical protein V1743_02630 [Nanoarchaeota archaeon]
MKKQFYLFWSLVVFLCMMSFSSADIGPHQAVQLYFHVTMNNESIADDFTALILVPCYQEDCDWQEDNGELCSNGICSFFYYRIERVPRQFRLQVDLAGRNYTSGLINFSWTSSSLFFSGDIGPEGNLTITLSDGRRIGADDSINDSSFVVHPRDISPVDKGSGKLWVSIVVAFFLTIIIELIVAAIFLKKMKVQKGWKRPLFTIVIADIFTVPLVWMVILYLAAVLLLQIFWSFVLTTIIAEAGAIIIEAYVLFFFNKKILPLKKAFLLSIIMNIASFAIGGAILLLLNL